MRLRNRQINAEWWTDPDLLRYPREKRMTYLGMACVCEDSGCVEFDPFGIKLVLWPSPVDADITDGLIGEWLSEWIAAGKFVVYEADSKSYLFMLHFHDYQKPRNPQSPNLPLPKWVEWTPNEKDTRKGRYDYHRDLLESSTSVVLPSNNGCPPRGGLVWSGLASPSLESGTTDQPSGHTASLPSCLSQFESDYEGLPGDLAQAIMSAAEAKWGALSPLDASAFRAIFGDTCFRDCPRTEAQARDCASTALKAIGRSKGSWRESKGLVRTILGNDRDDVEVVRA